MIAMLYFTFASLVLSVDMIVISLWQIQVIGIWDFTLGLGPLHWDVYGW